MAIRLITGVPGAGKTYLALKTLLDDYFKWDKKEKGFVPKKEITIITNIDSLDLDHINLDDAIRASKKNIEGFFSVEYQEKITNKYKRIVYVIDECQRFFDRRFYNKDVFYYFEYHRHLGHDIYLVTQDRMKIAKDISLLCETEIRAVKRTLAIAGEFKYNVLSDGIIIDRKICKPKKYIFALYRSSSGKESKKIKNPVIKILVVVTVMCAVSFWCLKNRLWAHVQEKPTEQIRSDIISKGHNQTEIVETKKLNPIDDYRWYRLQGTAFINGQLTHILDPETNLLIHPSESRFRLKITPKHKVYAHLPPDLYFSLIGVEHRDRAGANTATQDTG